MRYLIFIDSNPIIGSNYSIMNAHIKDFVKSYNKIAISQVTIDEVIRKYNINQAKQINVLDEIKSEVNRFGIQFEIGDIIDFKRKFSDELLELSVDILDFTKVDVDFIYRKAMQLKKPFKSKDEKEAGGLKDVLIWYSWLKYAKENHNLFDQIIIVTRDGDFIDQLAETLQMDLLEDIEYLELPVEKFRVVKEIKTLLERIILPIQNKSCKSETTEEEEQTDCNRSNKPISIDVDNTYVNENEDAETGKDTNAGTETNVDVEVELEIDVEDFFKDKADEVVDLHQNEIEASLEEVIAEIIGEEKEPSIRFLSRKDNMQFKDEYLVNPDGSYSIYFTEEFEIEFEYFLPKSEYYEIGNKNIEIEDSDWNDHVFLVSEVWFTEVGFEASFSIEEGKNIKLEDSDYFLGSEFFPNIDGSIYDDENED